MKTAKEFIQRLKDDEAFAKEVNERIQAKKDAGAKDYSEALLPAAAALGYEITKEQVETLRKKQSDILSEEELGKAAGGTSCVAAIVATATAFSSATVTVAVTTAVSDC